MSWEVILKTEKVWVLSEENWSDSIPIAVFKSEEALDKYLIKEHGETWPSREKLTEKEILEEIFMTYNYRVKEVEMKG
tara:strand:- start:1 stop:234 length:234 start_codon:yes stop_codon:yes gene_type:complete